MPRVVSLDAKMEFRYSFVKVKNGIKKQTCRATCRGCAVAKKTMENLPPIKPQKLKYSTRINEYVSRIKL